MPTVNGSGMLASGALEKKKTPLMTRNEKGGTCPTKHLKSSQAYTLEFGASVVECWEVSRETLPSTPRTRQLETCSDSEPEYGDECAFNLKVDTDSDDEKSAFDLKVDTDSDDEPAFSMNVDTDSEH